MKPKLYYVNAHAPDRENLALFVWAHDAAEAVDHWAAYFDGWDKPDIGTWIDVFEVPTRGMIGAVPWNVFGSESVELKEKHANQI